MTDQSVTKNKHTAILDAARAVFSRDGYAASSVEEVAAEAGIAKGTVYLYFSSKEELYLAALLRDVKAFGAAARTEMERAPHCSRRLKRFSGYASNTATPTRIFCGSISPNMARCPP